MGENPLKLFGQVLGDKPPGTVKELAKVLVDMTSKLESITTIIRSDIQCLVEDNKQSQRDMQEIKSSMDVMNKTFEQLRTDVHNVHRELSEMKHQQAGIIGDVRQLQGEVKGMRQEIIELKQYSRRNNLEIRNVPMSADESLPDMMHKLATSLKMELRTEDIDVVHRVPTKNKAEQNIVVRFTSTAVRDKMIKHAKKERLSTCTLGFQNNEPIYINEHLCQENKILLAKARQMRREKNWKYVWVSQTKILMRKTDNSRVLHVTSEDDLRKVV